MIAYTIAALLAVIGVALLIYAKVNDRSEAYALILAAAVGAALVLVGSIVALVRYWVGA